MQTYTFFMIGGLRPTPGFRFDEFRSLEDATEFARDLLDHTTYDAIEINRGDAKLAVVKREPGSSDPAALG